MKKLFYLLVIVGLSFTSCDPLEDINMEVDAANAITGVVVTDNYVVSDDDYEELELGFGNFSSLDDAKAMIPSLLSSEYPFGGEGSTINVTFDLFSRATTESSLVVYEVEADDYDANPDTERFDNFDDLDQIILFLNTKYPAPEDRVLVSLTYEFYDGATSTLNNGFLYTDNDWKFIQGFTEDEYAFMGEGFPNFSSEDEADAKLSVFLLDKFKFDTSDAGDIVPVMFKLFVTDEEDVDGDGSVEDRTTYSYVKNFIYDGSEWSAYNNVLQQAIQFGNDGTSWVPDNTINYTLTAEDYALVGNDRFGNFDVRSGSDEETEESRLAKINTILLNNFSGDEEGQKYAVSYNIYNGSNDVWTMNVILEGGVYVLQ